jgi:hypothetical protein
VTRGNSANTTVNSADIAKTPARRGTARTGVA